MQRYNHKVGGYGLLTRLIAMALILAMVTLAGGEMLIDHCDNGCETECSNPCDGCEDCFYCLRTLHMLEGVSASAPAASLSPGWRLPTVSLSIEKPLVASIDHPPRILS